MEQRDVENARALQHALNNPQVSVLVDKISVVWDSLTSWHLEDDRGREFNPIENLPGEVIMFVRLQAKLGTDL